MSLVVPNTADVLMLQYIINQQAQDGGSAPSGGQRLLRLFTNNITPGKNTVIGDLTEATQAGYSPITLTGTNWTVGTSGGVSSASYPQQIFTFTAIATVYGYYVTTSEATPQLLWVERFTVSPYVLPTTDGGQIAITPKITLN
jgi:hypothetical protein